MFTTSTSASEVWDTRGSCSSSSGVEQQDGIGELGSRTGGIPDMSGSSTGNRAARFRDGKGSGIGATSLEKGTLSL